MRRVASSLAVLALVSGCAGVPAPLEPESEARARSQHVAISRLRHNAPEERLDAADAAAVALAQNLDLRLAALQRLLADSAVDLADLQKLPQLLVRAGYSRRSHLETGDIDPLGRRTASQELSWDVLGFATAWLRAEAASDQTLAAALNQRDETNRVLLETRQAWYAVAHQDAREKLLAVADTRIREAVRLLGRLQNTTLVDPQILAIRENELWQQQSRLRNARQEAKAARARLASLLAVADGDLLRLMPPAADDRTDELAFLTRLQALSQENLERQALARRTDLRKTDVQVRMLRHEATYTWLSALPGVTLRGGRFRDTDTPREPQWWTESGYNLSFSLFNLFTVFQQHQDLNLRRKQLQLKQLALAVGVVEQVRIAREKLETQLALWADARTRLQLAEKRFRLWEDRIPFNPEDEFIQAGAAASYADARINADQSYEAALQAGWQLMQAVGLDFAPSGEPREDPAARLRTWWAALPGQLEAVSGGEAQP